MGTETTSQRHLEWISPYRLVKLNNPLMGTETRHRVSTGPSRPSMYS